jgi:hypothetical protein
MILSKSKIYKGIPSTTAFLLVVLFLMSPCAIRNSVEDALGLQIQKTLNANKVTLQQDNSCSINSISLDVSKVEKALKQFKVLSVQTYNFAFYFPVFERLTVQIQIYNLLEINTIPLYILFKKWKYFI